MIRVGSVKIPELCEDLKFEKFIYPRLERVSKLRLKLKRHFLKLIGVFVGHGLKGIVTGNSIMERFHLDW